MNLACLAIMKDTGVSSRNLLKIIYWIKDVLKRNGDLDNLPHEKTLMQKKNELVPEGVTSTKTEAKIPMKNLCEHTTKRSLMRPDIAQKMINSCHYEYVWKAGSDAQTGMGKINRPSEHDPDVSYNVGIQLLLIRKKDEPNNIIFNNNDAAGIRLYRPLEQSSKKETEENIVKTFNDLMEESSNLDEKLYYINDDKSVTISHTVIISMLDGKSRKAITQDKLKKRVESGVKDKEHGNMAKLDNNTCLLCLVPPKLHHKKESLKRNIKFPELLPLGVSPLHMKIKIMEVLFTASVKKKMSNEGCKEKEAKQHFQQAFLGKEGGGIRLFIPEPQKGGNSNTGGCANRFFKSAESTAKILNISLSLIQSLWKLLIMINETKNMVQVEDYKLEAGKCFDLYIQEFGN